MNQDIANNIITIQIGVTGHRTLQNKNSLLKKVNVVLKNEIIKLFDAKTQEYLKKETSTLIRYSLNTLLAEGADRLVAHAVLDYNKFSDINIILPMKLSDYKKTFKNPFDKEFDELYQKAKNIINLKKQDVTEELFINDKNLDLSISAREIININDAYKSAGIYMIENSDVLIALWDGKTNNGKGGTKDIIDYAREKELPIIIIYTNDNRPNKIIQGHSFLKLF